MFHGDLVERAMALLLALTGNWGKEGTGMRSWGVVYDPLALTGVTTSDPILREIVKAKSGGREMTEEEIESKAQVMQWRIISAHVPEIFFWYRHCGCREYWERVDIKSGEMPRNIPDYVEEALKKGWWKYLDLPDENVEPRVFFIVANNTLRNKPGMRNIYLKKLWPKLKLIVCIDYRWSDSALYSDLVLPGAFHHEKEQFHTICTPECRFWAYSDKAVDPVFDSKWEIEIALTIARKIVEKAREKGLETYRVPHGLTLEKLKEITGLEELGFEIDRLPEELERFFGVERRYEDLYDRVLYTMGIYELITESRLISRMERKLPVKKIERLTDEDIRGILRNVVNYCVETGVFEEGTTLEKIKREGFVKYAGLGKSVYGLNQAADVKPDRVVVALEKHVKDKKPFPTLTGRAQFYIDHEWFLEAGEELPCYKKPPAVLGGDRSKYPYYLTSGHNRYSTHGITLTNELQLNLHRGEPHVFISKKAAEKKGIKDGDYIRVFNDFGEVIVQAKVSSLLAENQIVFYHGWDGYLFPNGKSLKNELSPFLIKPLHLAGGYGHLNYRFVNWQPQPIYRHVCVDFERIEKPENH
jgi:anaerobic selenocysteine-containing dehydrogenase